MILSREQERLKANSWIWPNGGKWPSTHRGTLTEETVCNAQMNDSKSFSILDLRLRT